MLYAPIRLFNLGLHNYKVEKQNKQIKTSSCALNETLRGWGGELCVGGGGRGYLFPW